MAEAASIFYGVESLVEGTLAIAKGIYDPTLPLKANVIPIKDINLPRAYHSISVIKGRAYVFGGKQEGEELADNAMHIINLPSSGIESTDYQRLEPTATSPPARYGHSAAVIDDQIYIYGGSDLNGALEENGKVWIFDTTTNLWSSLNAAKGEVPGARTWATATASIQPQPEHHRADENVAPQLPPDPEKMMPEPLTPSTYGTFVLYGGVTSKEEKPTSDLWTFDVSSKTWSQLPAPPIQSPTSQSPAITFVNDHLYVVSGPETHHLLLDLKSTSTTNFGTEDLGPTPIAPWSKVSANMTPDRPTPDVRSAAALTPITTGQGRNYLLLLGGHSQTQTYQDIWTLQLPPSGMTAASFKDAARMALKRDTGEQSWAEVKYYDEQGKLIQESQQGRGIGQRKGFAACKDVEIDGGTVLVWGGMDGGKVRGDGLLVEVEK